MLYSIRTIHWGRVQMLVEQHMLTAEEEQDLISELSFRPEDGWLQLLYRYAARGEGRK